MAHWPWAAYCDQIEFFMTRANREYNFFQVDVFTERMFGGNSLAVFLSPDGLSDHEMQEIAKEMNLSETVFVLPSQRTDCLKRLRIFTPRTELPFAGHPTVGTTYVLAVNGLLKQSGSVFQVEEGVGPVSVEIEGNVDSPARIWMRHPRASFGAEVQERAKVADAIALAEGDLLAKAPLVVGSTGLSFLYIPLRSRDLVDAAVLDAKRLRASSIEPSPEGAFVFSVDADTNENRVYSRMLDAGNLGIPEDPATGSASGPLGAYLVLHKLVHVTPQTTIVSEQGTKMGRQSFIHIRVGNADGEVESIEVGGSVVPVLEGTVTLPS